MNRGVALIAVLFFLAIPVLIIGGGSLLFAEGSSSWCAKAPGRPAQQPADGAQANSIPANYLYWYKKVGVQYNIPWTVLAGIGTEESDNGQSTLPGVHSGTNPFGAAGPMQIGVRGASTNTWASVATSEDGIEPPSVYDPADAIAGAAKYLNMHGFQQDPSAAIFAYNHADWYVTAVLNYASQYAASGSSPGPLSANCADTGTGTQATPNQAVATAIKFAQEQIGKPYLLGGTGPDAFDCSGLVMMAYRTAGINIPRTSAEQYHFGPAVAASAISPGDLVFFAGANGTPANPGHVGLVIGTNTMIEAYATGFPVRVSTFGLSTSAPGDQAVVGFTRPWEHSGLTVPLSVLTTPAVKTSASAAGAP